jgi:putative endopeptidase
MRFCRELIALALLPAMISAQNGSQHSVEMGDIDRGVAPCTNFYDYANGKWRAQNPIPASMDRWSRRWQAGERNKDQLKTLLEEVSQRKDWPKRTVEQLISDHYASCMDEPRVNQAGFKVIETLLKDIADMKSARDIQPMIAQLHEISVDATFGVYSDPDFHNPGQVIAYIAASGLGLPERDYYLKPDARFDEARKKYLQHIAKMFRLAGHSEAAVNAEAQTVLQFETALAGASLDRAALRDPNATDHKKTFAELTAMMPAFDWVSYFRTVRLPQSDLNVDQPTFMAELQRQLEKTPLDDWKVYLSWRLLSSAAPWLSQPFVDESFAFNGKYLDGRQENKPRWKRCVESTDELLGEALGRKYVERYFPPAAKARMQEMVQNILLAMKDTIDGLEWMGPETKKLALEKLSTFNPKIGYPDRWKDYGSLTINRSSFWANVAAGRKFNVNDDHARIGKPVDRGRWMMTPPTSNAYYNPLLNEIVFPAGILQPPAFDMNAVDAVNYGAIGVVIGHEVSHGFDDQGAKYDASGRLKNWWTPDDLDRFQKRTQCVLDQFEGYEIETGIHHNGKLVLGESIGDLAGAKIAYLAFKKSEAKKAAPTIDGLTPDQQFFIAWGQFRGDATRPETQRLMVQRDPHPVARFRVIGPLSNLPVFQKTFACQDDSPMVRTGAKRCEVW